MPLYKCSNCPLPTGDCRVFEADDPVCPCGIDGRDPEMAGIIRPVETIHFDPPHPVVKGRGTRQAACGHGRVGSVVGRSMVLASGERDAVNCKACKETAVFKGDASHTGLITAGL